MLMQPTMNNLPYYTTLLLVFVFFFLLSIVPSQSEEPAYFLCDTENATAQISKNIESLLPKLVNNTYQNGSNNATSGKSNSKIYGLAQCIGDVPNGACASCIENATEAAIGHCRDKSGAAIWYDYCFLRYSTRNFYGEVDGGSDLILRNTEKVTNYKKFNKALTDLMNKTTLEALASPKGFGQGTEKVLPSDDDTIYALLQCTIDLLDPAYKRCGQCLDKAKSYLKSCYNHRGCRVFFKSCFLRYEVYSFFYNGTSGGT
ncbi:cysteine-rich repeat secretory protein 55 [Phtheirospermum japonicum]|uniref:Cysteine-rich repeat secretory protein 55 n=1 Tax=Phtheirospermum japonicum TaxID=374723 RepID=A0A830CVA5_9LAMI|nr:cysteine-rich repeat secretory protein 55 [Phtheirospermum japonicum]